MALTGDTVAAGGVLPAVSPFPFQFLLLLKERPVKSSFMCWCLGAAG